MNLKEIVRSCIIFIFFNQKFGIAMFYVGTMSAMLIVLMGGYIILKERAVPKSFVKQYYKDGSLFTEITYNSILVDTKKNLVDLDLNDSIKLLRYNEALLLLEKYRRFDSIAKMSKDNYKLILPVPNTDTISKSNISSEGYEYSWGITDTEKGTVTFLNNKNCIETIKLDDPNDSAANEEKIQKKGNIRFSPGVIHRN